MKISPKYLKDWFFIIIIAIATFFFASAYDVLEKIVEIFQRYEKYEIDELITVIIVLVFCLTIFAYRRWGEAVKSTKELTKYNEELAEALTEIKILKGVIQICGFCKNIRDNNGYWQEFEAYIVQHSEAKFSHGVCPKCMEEHYHDYE